MHCITRADGCRRLRGLANYALNMRGDQSGGFTSSPDLQGRRFGPLVSPRREKDQKSKAPPCLVLSCLSSCTFHVNEDGGSLPLSQERRRRTQLSHVVPVNWFAESCRAELGESCSLAVSRFTAVSSYQKVRLDCALTRQLKMRAFT